MKKELEVALNTVELTYTELVEIANDIINEYTAGIDPIIKTIEDNIENLTNDDLRSLMLRLSIKAYSFGDIKERSAIKAECAEMLKKEAYARSFTQTEGSVANKDNLTVLQIGNEIVTECIYDLVANLFKVKLEELRRLIDTLKTILTSRLSEMKMSSSVNTYVEENQ
jgi:hypothetical protein